MKTFAAFLVALALPTLVGAQDPAVVYARRCAPCHGKDGRGTSLGRKIAAADLSAVKGTEADIADVISNGKGKMSPYKDRLSADEIQALAKFVKSGLK